MLNRSTEIGFSRGLHTDSLGVPGALLEAQDVVITREGELRKRGGKATIGAVTSASEGFQSFYNAVCAHGLGTLVNYKDGSGVDRMGRRLAGGSFVTLGTRRTNTNGFGTNPFGFTYGEFYSMFAHNGEIMSSASTGTDAPIRWKGSTMADYITGTLSTTSGSATITGSGTSWTTNAEAGMYLYIDSSGLKNRTFLVTAINSDTSLTVDQAPDATVAGASYCLTAVGAIGCDPSVFPGGYNHPTGLVSCSHLGRIFTAYLVDSDAVQAERIRWSATPSEASGKFLGVDYWHASAYTDIAVGLGGDITSLSSVGGELVILKEGAVCALRGVVATDGSDLGARVDLVSSDHGCLHARGVAATKIGLVFCDNRGVFVYANGQIRSLTEGRVQRHWDTYMTGETWVSVVGDRVIFTDQSSSGYIAVYDIATDTWSTQSAARYGKVIQTFTSTGAREYEMGFRKVADATDNWAGDFSTSASQDAINSSAPDLQVVTHPIALTDPVGNARPVRVDVNGFASDDAELAVSLIPGRQGGSEHSVGTLPASTSDKPHRLRVPPGASMAPYYQVKLATSGTMSDARIYGVSILSAPSGRVDV